MNSADRRRSSVAVLMLVGVSMVAPTGPGRSQVFDCEGLRRRIAALDRGGGGPAAARYVRSARRQQAEIDRTVAYRRSLGCERDRYSLFGGSQPAECARIDAQIERMNDNLASLQQSMARMASGESEERGELTQRYEVYCPQPRDFAAVGRRGGDLDRSFPPDDGPLPDAGFRRMPLDPRDRDDAAREGRDRDEAPPAQADTTDDGIVTGGPKAVCVKTCDGSFFPVSYAASRGNFDSLTALCRASCPNAETRLFTYSVTTEIAQAVDRDGKPYSDLPNANRFSKVHDPSCSCRAPGKTWLETLTEAERLYAGGKHDVVVTQQMSDALALPVPVTASKAQSASRKAVTRRLPNTASDAAQASTANASPDVQPAAPRPPAGTDGTASLRGTGEAELPGTETNGGKPRVRVVAPNL